MPELRVEGTVCIWLALGLLFLPFSWLIAAILAACFHELCHVAAGKLCGVSFGRVTVGTGGAVMELQNPTRWEELAIAVSGPCGSLLLVLLMEKWPQLAICGLVQGLFNLLPVYPLDGGRMACCLLGKWAVAAEILAMGCILLAGAVLSFGYEVGYLPALLAAIICIKAIQRKFPCKEAAIGVQ